MENPSPDAIDGEVAARVAELFRSLSDPNRLRLISVLAKRECCVGDLAQAVGASDSSVSHHLRGLRQLHLVRARKSGKQVFYSLEDNHIAELYQRGLDHILHG